MSTEASIGRATRVGAHGTDYAIDPIVLRFSELYGEPAGAKGTVTGGEAREMMRAVREAQRQGRVRAEDASAELEKLKLIEQVALLQGKCEAWTSTDPISLIEFEKKKKTRQQRRRVREARKKNRPKKKHRR